MHLQQQLAAVSLPIHKLYEPEFDPMTFVKFCKSSADDTDYLPKLNKEIQSFLKDTRKKLESLVQRDFERLLEIPQKLASVDAGITEAINKLESQALAYSTKSLHIQRSAKAAAEKVAQLKEVEARMKKLEATLETEKCLATLERVVPALKSSSHTAEVERASRLVEVCMTIGLEEYWGRVSFHRSALIKLLEREVKTCLSTQAPGRRLGSLMRSLCHMDAAEAAELMLTELYLRPIVDHEFTAARTQSDIVSAFLSSVLKSFKSGPLQVVRELGHVHPRLHVFTVCLWPCVKDALVEELKETVPTFFKEFSSAFNVFLKFVSEVALSPHELQFFLQSSSYQSFLSKWNLGTFFSLRQQEIIRPLVTVLASRSLDEFLTASPHLVFWQALQKTWDAEVYIPQIAFRFLRLTFQVISRYTGFVSKRLNDQSKAGQVNSGTLVRLLESLNWLRTTVAQELQGLCPDISSGVVDECCDLIGKTLEPCLRCLSELITKQVCGSLDVLRSIPSVYRLSNKPVPTSASPAIAKLLQSYEEVKHVFTQPGYETKLLEKVTVKCFEVFAEVAEDIQKSKEMLSKYQVEGQDDALKMRTQLALDTSAFVKLVESYGLNSYEVLRQLQSQAEALIN
jgi:hypothetical protein